MDSKRKKTTVDEQIDENLRRVYDDALSEKLPDRFTDLIKQLKAGGTGAAKGGDGE